MRRYASIIGSLVVLGIVGGGFAASTASGGTTRTVTVIRKITDLEWQGDPQTPNVGDRFEFTSQLLKNGDVIGHQGAACTVVQASDTEHTLLCTSTSRLPGGTISVQAYTMVDGRLTAIAITGGTGIYRDARGQVEFEPLGGTRARVTFELS